MIRGGRSLGLGIVNGMAALIREPIRHYRRHGAGASALAVGFSKGLAQAVASPIVGVFDAINHIGTGLALTPDYLHRRTSLDRAAHRLRLPRAFYGLGRSIRVFDAIDAVVVQALQAARPPIDSTLHSVFMGGLLNDVRAYALVIRGVAAFQITQNQYAAKMLWFVSWSNVKSFELIEHGIKIFSLSSTAVDESSCLLIWLAQPRQAYDLIVATHSRYRAALRVSGSSPAPVNVSDRSSSDGVGDSVNFHSRSVSKEKTRI